MEATPTQLRQYYAELSEPFLLKAFALGAERYQPEVWSILEAEVARRRTATPEDAEALVGTPLTPFTPFTPYAPSLSPARPILQVEAPEGDPPYFAVSLSKLAVLHLFSFGLYGAYWFYRQWRREEERTRDDITPWARAVFAPLFAYALFTRIGSHLREEERAALPAPFLLAAMLILGSAAVRLPDPWWLLSLLSFLPLLPMQRAINRLNARTAPSADRNAHYTGANVLLIVLGLLILLSVILGMYAGYGAPAGSSEPGTPV